MGAFDWSPIPAQNAISDPTIPARDGSSGRELPSQTRGVMAGVAALVADQGGALVTTGADNTYDVVTKSGVARPQPGTMLSFWADRDNTAQPALNVDGTGPRQWLAADGASLPAGYVQAGILYTVAWSEALPGSLPAWRMVGSGVGGSVGLPAGVDFSGSPSERALYDAQPKGKTFLAVADTPIGPTWTLFLKRSNGFADWSAGLPIKASAAQTTVEAQAAADRAAAQAAAAAKHVAAATEQAGLAEGAQSRAKMQADLSAAERAAATERAAAAAVSAIEARSVVQIVGLQIFDFSADSAPSATDDWSN